MHNTQWVLAILGGMIFLGFVWFGLVSLRESESRAALISFLLAGGSAAFFALLVYAPSVLRMMSLIGILAAILTLAILFLLPIGKASQGDDLPKQRFDERDVIFTRFFRIQPGTAEYDQYYRAHPDKKEADELTRAQPGLNAPGSLFYHPVLAAAVDSSFFLTESLIDTVDGPVAPEQTRFDTAA